MDYRELAQRVDAETRYLSGGYEKNEAYGSIIALGEDALSELILDVGGNEGDPWWRIQAIGEITERAGNPIPWDDFPERDRGQLVPVKDFVLKWATSQGLPVW